MSALRIKAEGSGAGVGGMSTRAGRRRYCALKDCGRQLEPGEKGYLLASGADRTKLVGHTWLCRKHGAALDKLLPLLVLDERQKVAS